MNNSASTSGKPIRTIALVLCVLAAGMGAWVGLSALGTGALPPGCGEGAGCGEVLTSPWSRWYGLPVAWGAVGAYVALAISLVARKPKATAFFATTVLGGVVWFVFLQAAVMRVFCLYCMIDHGIGSLAAILALRLARPSKAPILLGLAATLLFAGLHALQPRRIHTLRAPVEGDADFRSPDGRRGLALLEGALVLDVAASPLIGSPDATQILVTLVDYACPHCRALHHELVRHQQQHPEDLAFLVLPPPIPPDCNPLMQQVPERFNDSCDIALLSLGLFHTHPELWPDFDLWLFEPTTPRTLWDVRQHLEYTLGADPDALKAHPSARADLTRNVGAFADLPVDDPGERRLPVLLAAGHPPVIGPAGRLDRLPHLVPVQPHPESPE
ncbi:MAG: hypothetical protein LAT83_16645 [Kiritimatiellae bacterium]|nr:hypothetical protein [Kiritimatiellia bacterium]